VDRKGERPQKQRTSSSELLPKRGEELKHLDEVWKNLECSFQNPKRFNNF
jgi:hypothetical protein